MWYGASWRLPRYACLSDHCWESTWKRRLAEVSKRILSVSYDKQLLATRSMLLHQEGYDVATACTVSTAIALSQIVKFDLFVFCHSIPYKEKQELLTILRTIPTPILFIDHHGGERLRTGEYQVSADPEGLLKAVAGIFENSNLHP